MRVLIACEESQRICIEFRKRGHEAYSCDIIPCSGGHPEWHIQGDVLDHLNEGWDLMIANVPCTYLTPVGNRWFKTDPSRYQKRLNAAIFWMILWHSDIPRVCIENPQGYMNTHWKKPSCTIHPYYFGDPDLKRTCLWYRGLPDLQFDPEKYPKPKPLYICQGEKCKGKKIYRTEGLKGFTQKQRQIERSKTVSWNCTSNSRTVE